MRPRVFPAEDTRYGRRFEGSPFCFNEAAGIPRGRLEIRAVVGTATYKLQ